MDTAGIRLFVLAAERLNISAAGRALGLAPAVASARLAKLEKTVGSELLHRSTRKVSLSLEGEEFLPYAREILAQEDAALDAMGQGRSQPTGTIRFAAPSTFAQLYVIPILPEFLQRYPGINLDLRLSDVRFDLIEGSFDLTLRNQALDDSSLKARKLADDKRILCASPTYLRKHAPPEAPDELSQHQLIGFQDQTRRRLLGDDGSAAIFDPQAAGCRLIVDDGLSQKLATLGGAGISINSVWSVHRELESGELIHVLPNFHVEDHAALWLVYPKSNVLTAKTRVLIDFLAEKIGALPCWKH